MMTRETVGYGFFVTSLVVMCVAGMRYSITLPSELALPAQAISGGACDKRANVTARGGGVSPGETAATKQEKDACIPQACFATADGGQQCGTKPALQAQAGGGGGLLDAIGKMMEKMMGGGEKKGGDQPSNQASVDYQYGVKPTCTDFQVSSGAQPVEAGTQVFFSWRRAGGQTEQVTITPAIGIPATESPVTFSAPLKSTTYSLTLGNRSGSTTCTTRIFVGPKGSALSAEDEAFVKAAVQKGTAEATTTSTTTTAVLHDPSRSTRYTDLGQPAPRATADDVGTVPTDTTRTQTQEPVTSGVVYSQPDRVPHIASTGIVDEGYVDPHAFDADPDAFVEDEDIFVADTAQGKGEYFGSSDLTRLEEDMRAIMNARRVAQQSTTSRPTQNYERPDVGVTGSLGVTESAPSHLDAAADASLFGRVGTWLRSTFCFWCVVSVSQGGSVLLSQADQVEKNVQVDSSPAKDPAQKNKDIEKECKVLHDKARDKLCGNVSDSGRNDLCILEFNTYETGINRASFVQPLDSTSDDIDDPVCSTVPKGCERCGAKGVSKIPPQKTSGSVEGVCAEDHATKFRYVCRKENPAKPPQGTLDDQKQKKKSEPSAGNPDTSKPPPSNDPSAGPQQGPENGKDQKGGGGDPSKMLEALSKMMEKKGGEKQQQQDPCSLGNAQTNPACNPALPTAAPSCGPASTVTVQQPSESFLSSITNFFTGGTTQTVTTVKDEALTVSPSVLYKGQTGSVSWAVTGKGNITTVVTYVTTDTDGSTVTGSLGAVTGPSGSAEVSPERSTTYTLKATNEIGTVSCKPQRISVRPRTTADDAKDAEYGDLVDDEKLVVTCSPTSYIPTSGEQPYVEWRGCPRATATTFGTSTEDGTFTTGGEVSGTADVSPKRDSTYVVRCRNQYNEELARASCRITVDETVQSQQTSSRAVPTVEIAADNDVVEYGDSVRVTWRSKNATSCTIYGPGCTRFGRSSPKCFKEIGRSGFVIGNLYETSDFVAECRGANRASIVTDEIVIEVGATQPSLDEVSADTVPVGDLDGGDADEMSLDELLGQE